MGKKTVWKAITGSLAVVATGAVLAGCAPVREPLSKNDYTQIYNDTSVLAVNSVKLANALHDGNKKQTKKYKAYIVKKAKGYRAKTQKQVDLMKEHKTFTTYPAEVYKYGQLVLQYQAKLEKLASKKDLQKSYHKISAQALKVNATGGYTKKLKKITEQVLLQDPKYVTKTTTTYSVDSNGKVTKSTSTGKSSSKSSKSKSKSKSKSTSSKKKSSSKTSAKSSSKKSAKSTKKESKQSSKTQSQKTSAKESTPSKKNAQNETPVSVIYFNPIKSILLVVTSILLIFVIFRQPSKSDDNMGALSSVGGDSMFSKPKPRGFELFMIRTTRVLILVLLGIMYFVK